MKTFPVYALPCYVVFSCCVAGAGISAGGLAGKLQCCAVHQFLEGIRKQAHITAVR